MYQQQQCAIFLIQSVLLSNGGSPVCGNKTELCTRERCISMEYKGNVVTTYMQSKHALAL